MKDESNSTDTSQGRISDLIQRVAALERGSKKQSPQPKQKTRRTVWFPNEVVLVDESGTGVSASTDWADSGSAKFVPNNAVEIIVFAGVKDTNVGVGETTIYAQAAGVVSPISRIYEDSSGASSSGFCERRIPTVGGRFDWRIELAFSATWVKYKISILGYVVEE